MDSRAGDDLYPRGLSSAPKDILKPLFPPCPLGAQGPPARQSKEPSYTLCENESCAVPLLGYN